MSHCRPGRTLLLSGHRWYLRRNASLLKRGIPAACINILLAERVIISNFATEAAYPCRTSSASRESAGIKLKYEPPVDRMSFFQERHRSALHVCRIPDAVGIAPENRKANEYNSPAQGHSEHRLVAVAVRRHEFLPVLALIDQVRSGDPSPIRWLGRSPGMHRL